LTALSVFVSSQCILCGGSAIPIIYALTLHDALPIYRSRGPVRRSTGRTPPRRHRRRGGSGTRSRSVATVSAPSYTVRASRSNSRSEEHTSELQSRENLVCRLLLENHNLQIAHVDLLN